MSKEEVELFLKNVKKKNTPEVKPIDYDAIRKFFVDRGEEAFLPRSAYAPEEDENDVDKQ